MRAPFLLVLASVSVLAGRPAGAQTAVGSGLESFDLEALKAAALTIPRLPLHGQFEHGAPSWQLPPGAWFHALPDSFRGDELVLDGRKVRCTAFVRTLQWSNFNLKANLRVESAPVGAQAGGSGFVFRASDRETHYTVRFEENEAVLARSRPTNAWTELKRVDGLKSFSGRWHDVGIEMEGTVIRVSLDGRQLFEVSVDQLASGHLGVFAEQGLARVRDLQITGLGEAPLDAFNAPEPSWTRVVQYASEGGYEGYPSICRLRDGRLMCVYYAGFAEGYAAYTRSDDFYHRFLSDKYSRGGFIAASYSSDGGRTWTRAHEIYQGPWDDRDPSVMELADGTILCAFTSVKRSEGPVVSDVLVGTFLVSSQDGGQTWSEAQNINERVASKSNLRLLSTGELVLAVRHEVGGVSEVGVVKSANRGKTWGEFLAFDCDGAKLDGECDLIELGDGSLYCVMQGTTESEVYEARSSDGGESWTKCVLATIRGHALSLHRAPGGVLIAAYKFPKLPARPSETILRVSRDGGRTWGPTSVAQSYWGGNPSLVGRKDGSLVIAFEVGNGNGRDVWVRRFNVSGDRIEWLSLQ